MKDFAKFILGTIALLCAFSSTSFIVLMGIYALLEQCVLIAAMGGGAICIALLIKAAIFTAFLKGFKEML